MYVYHAKRVKVNQEAYAVVIKTLMAKPCTAQQLADESGLHLNTALDLMRAFRRHGIVHIGAWAPNTLGVDTIAVFKFGPGTDKARRVKSSQERCAEYRARQKLVKRDYLVSALHADVYDYRGFKVRKGITVIVDHHDPYFRPEGYQTTRIAHGIITRFIASRGINEERKAA